MEINFINTITVGTRIPVIPIYVSEPVFILLKISANREYINGKYSNKIITHTYLCVDTINFHQFSIKLDGQTEPLMSDEELQELRKSGKKIYVEFQNLTVMPYVNERNHSISDSFRADGVSLVETD